MNREVVIAGACRTPIGRMGGALASLSAEKLGAVVIRDSLRRAGIEPASVDEVLMGCVIQAGLGQNVARQALIRAGLPVEVPGITLNVVCGSGLESVNKAAALVLAGEADIVVAGGMESMSNAPYLLSGARFGYRLGNGDLIDAMVNDALIDAFNEYHMMVTAENICHDWGIRRKELDAFAVESQKRCAEAMAAKRFSDEITPIEIVDKKGNTILIENDENPRPNTTIDMLSRLKCASGVDGGSITAGNSSSINDGAAAMVVLSSAKAQELGVKPLCRWVCGALVGVQPEIMGIGPVAAVRKVLEKTSLALSDIDLIEANEAFASQSIAVTRDLGLDMSLVNVNGGAIALGHPVGASGARILTTLIYEMRRRDSRRGLATLCIGGGMGSACIVER